MNLQDIENLYLKRQSCRSYADTVVPEKLVREICRVALLAPSAVNAQPWQLIAVSGNKAAEVATCVQRLGMNKFAAKVSTFVVVAEGKGNLMMKIGSIFKENEFIKNDLGILTAHLVLAAEAAGLSSCIIGWRDEEKLRTLLGLDKNVRIPIVVALGYPEEGYSILKKKRKPLDEVFTLIK